VDKEESEKGITWFKRTQLAGMNSYSGRVWVLLGQILAIGLGERVHTQRPDRSASPAGWVEWAVRGRGESSWPAGPRPGFQPMAKGK
jgi:hypothetical protein